MPTDYTVSKWSELNTKSISLAGDTCRWIHPIDWLPIRSRADWNDKLRILSEAQKRYECQKEIDESTGKRIDRQRVLSLVKDFPAIWNDVLNRSPGQITSASKTRSARR